MMVAMGEPVCQPADYLVATQEFVAFARSRGKTATFIAVGRLFLESTRMMASTVLHLGDDWIFPVSTYTPRGDHAKKVRSASNQIVKRGGRVREYHPRAGEDAGLQEPFGRLISRWLALHSRFQMHFLSLDLYKFADLKRYFYLEHEGRPVAILSCLPTSPAAATSSRT